MICYFIGHKLKSVQTAPYFHELQCSRCKCNLFETLHLKYVISRFVVWTLIGFGVSQALIQFLFKEPTR